MKKLKKLSTTKKIIYLCIINGIIWVYCSYILAFIGMIMGNEYGASIAESLSIAAVTEILGSIVAYCAKALLEKRKDFGQVREEYDNER